MYKENTRATVQCLKKARPSCSQLGRAGAGWAARGWGCRGSAPLRPGPAPRALSSLETSRESRETREQTHDGSTQESGRVATASVLTSS